MEAHGRQPDAIISSSGDPHEIKISSNPWNAASRMTVFLLFLILIGVIRINTNLVNSVLPPGDELAESDALITSAMHMIDTKMKAETERKRTKKEVVNAFTPAGYDPNAEIQIPVELHVPIKSEIYGVFIAGCAMSSAMNFFLKQLLKQYGVKIMETCYAQEVSMGGNWEIMKEGVNRFFPLAQNNMSHSLELMMEEVIETGQSAVIKLEQMSSEVVNTLRTIIKPKLIYAYRGNVLDKLVCEIRDCFLKSQPHVGYPVNAETGEKDDQCFNRRLPGGPKTKAYISPEDFIKTLNQKMRASVNRHEKYQKAFYDNYYFLPKVSTEDLWAFEFKDVENGYTKSVVAWSQILLAWGFIPDEQKIVNVMNAYGFLERWQKPHNDTIYNLNELLEKFGNMPIFRRFLRLSN